MEYLLNGCTISLAIGIDFTISNGSPMDTGSLHSFFDSTASLTLANQYLAAISAVGGVLMQYDTDQNVPVLGFGAKVPCMAGSSDCFALNGNIFAPEIHSIDKVIECYQRNVTKLTFHGPTNLAPIIKYTGDIAEHCVMNNALYQYFILLLITDGLVTDVEATKDEIVRCSALPMSVIVVEVGNEDFGEMEWLGDSDLYSEKYKMKMARDIIQLVPFKRYLDNPMMLAKETLAKLPRQFLDYMTSKNIPPLPASGTVFNTGLESVYSKRKAEFAAKVLPYCAAERVEAVLDAGFPTEDPNQFFSAIQQEYFNVLGS